jgi:hypothetical protein
VVPCIEWFEKFYLLKIRHIIKTLKKSFQKRFFFSLLLRRFFFNKSKDIFLLKTLQRRKAQEPNENILNSH